MQRYQMIFLTCIALAGITLAGCARSETATDAAGESTADSKTADAVTAASIVSTTDAFALAASADGTWIVAVTQDIEFDEEVVIAGQFTNRDEVYRKIALYDQDAEYNVTERYTLTAPRLVVRSENTRIQGGVINGDVVVETNDFHVYNAVIEGDVYFAEESYRSSFSRQEGGEVTGELILQ